MEDINILKGKKVLIVDDERDVLETLTPEVIHNIFQQVYLELLPYFHRPLIVEQSKYDQYGETDLTKLQSDLNSHYDFLLRRREAIHNTVMLQRQ